MARSKAYPTINLEAAIQASQHIWDKHNRQRMTLEEATVALGYKGISGPSRSKVSALKQYGLLEEANNSLSLTQRAIVVLHKEKGDDSRTKAIQSAFNDVAVFADLMADYPNASEGAVSSHLLTEHSFTESGAKQAAKSYLESLKFVNDSTGGTMPGETPPDPEDSQDPPANESPPDGGGSGAKGKTTMKREAISIGSGGNAVLEWPITRTQHEWDDLEYWLKGVLRKAKRDIESLASEPEPESPDPSLDDE